MKKPRALISSILLAAAFILAYFVCIPIFAYPIQGENLSHEIDRILQTEEYRLHSYTILETNVLPASIIVLLRRESDGRTMYLHAEKYLFYSRYKVAPYLQEIREGNILHDLFYKIRLTAAQDTVEVSATFSPKLSMHTFAVILLSISLLLIRSITATDAK